MALSLLPVPQMYWPSVTAFEVKLLGMRFVGASFAEEEEEEEEEKVRICCCCC